MTNKEYRRTVDGAYARYLRASGDELLTCNAVPGDQAAETQADEASRVADEALRDMVMARSANLAIVALKLRVFREVADFNLRGDGMEHLLLASIEADLDWMSS